MRRDKNLKSDRQKRLNELFPNLIDLAHMENQSLYKRVSISIFDHWLTEEEVEMFLNNVSEQEQQMRDGRFCKLNNIIIEKAELNSFHFIGKKQGILRFSEFKSKASALKALKPEGLSGNSKNHFSLVFPKMKAVYFGSSPD